MNIVSTIHKKPIQTQEFKPFAQPDINLAMGVSETALRTQRQYTEMNPTPGTMALATLGYGAPGNIATASLSERLYNAAAEAKIKTAQIAMHIDRAWRNRLFAQIDELLNEAEWPDGEEPLNPASFTTFLRIIIRIAPERMPGLGISNRGYLIAGWGTPTERLTVECDPDDKIRWSVACPVDGADDERAAGDSTASRIMAVLEPYRPERWFFRHAR